MTEDSVRGVAGFLTDAARGAVSTRTVVQVLRHWVGEGLTFEELHAAVAHARTSLGQAEVNGGRLTRYENAIRAGLELTGCSHQP